MSASRINTHALKNAIPFSFPLVAAVAIFLMSMVKIKALAVIAFFLVLAAGAGILILPPAQVLLIYVSYIYVEGALKIFTNYNPVIHVGSDLLLISIFARLIIRRAKDEELRKQSIADTGLIVPSLMIFWIWVGVQFFNPWGLGVVPSLAAMKIYAVPMLLFFVICFLLKKEEIRYIPFVILSMGFMEAVIATYDGMMGDSFIPSLHPRYAQTMGIAFIGDLYRPFGTTHLPGGPAALVMHTLLSVFMVLEALKEKDQQGNYVHNRAWYLVVLGFFPAALSALFLCQVRTALIRFALTAFAGLVLAGGRKAVRGIFQAGVLGVGLYFVSSALPIGSSIDADRFMQISDRFFALADKKTWKESRQGAVEAMLLLSEKTSWGIGLSRVGASSSLWDKLIKKDRYFGKKWSFADNVYRAIFTEIGIVGLLAYLANMGIIMYTLIRKRTYFGLLAAANVAFFMLAGWGSEGILYLPDAAFFWIYVALGLRFQPATDT